jgi:hypothetical protein
MLKVVLCGHDDEMLIRATRFFRDRGIETYLMPSPDERYMRALQRAGVSGALVSSSEPDAWKKWLRNHGWKGAVIYQ